MNATNDARHLRGQELEKRCVELRGKSMTHREIAALCGCSEKAVHNHLKHAFALNDADIAKRAEVARGVELAKLDEWERRALAVLDRNHLTFYQGEPVSLLLPADGDVPDDQIVICDIADHDTGEVSQIKCRRVPVIDDGPVLQAISTLLRVADRRAKLLGLDAPAKVEQSGGIESSVTVRVITLVPSAPDVVG